MSCRVLFFSVAGWGCYVLQLVGGAWFDAFADAGDFAFYAYGLGWSVLVGEVLLKFSDGERLDAVLLAPLGVGDGELVGGGDRLGVFDDALFCPLVDAGHLLVGR